jgi:hypothetical protein
MRDGGVKDFAPCFRRSLSKGEGVDQAALRCSWWSGGVWRDSVKPDLDLSPSAIVLTWEDEGLAACKLDGGAKSFGFVEGRVLDGSEPGLERPRNGDG